MKKLYVLWFMALGAFGLFACGGGGGGGSGKDTLGTSPDAEVSDVSNQQDLTGSVDLGGTGITIQETGAKDQGPQPDWFSGPEL